MRRIFLKWFFYVLLAVVVLQPVMGFAITAQVYNATTHTFVTEQEINVRWLTGNAELTTTNARTDGSGAVQLKADSKVATPDRLELITNYLGYNFYAHSAVSTRDTAVTLNVFNPKYSPEDISIRLFHTIISGMQDKLIFDVRLVINNKAQTYFVSGNNGFVYPFVHGATLIGSSPQATTTANLLFFRDGLRPGENFFSYTFSIPFKYNRNFEFIVNGLYPIENLLVIGDAYIDVNGQGAEIDRKIKTVNDVNVAFYTARNLAKGIKVLVIPVKNNNFFLLEIITGLIIGFGAMFLLKLKNRPVPAFDNLVKNIGNREKYDKEMKK